MVGEATRSLPGLVWRRRASGVLGGHEYTPPLGTPETGRNACPTDAPMPARFDWGGVHLRHSDFPRSIPTNALSSTVLSWYVRPVTRLPSITHGRSTYRPSPCCTSSAHLATVVAIRPF